MNSRKRIGVVGAGFIGRTHIRTARNVPSLDVVGFVDPQAKTSHADFAGLQNFASLDAMFDYGVDGVVVAVPDALHVPIASECLRRGAAVLLEKPAANSLAECVTLARCVPDVDDRLLIGHQRRHHPASRLTKQLIASGRLGTIVGVNGVFAVKKDEKYFVERPRSVGLTNLIHDLDILQFYLGRITHLSAAISHAGRKAHEVDTMAFNMNFESGAIGTMIGSDCSPSPWGWDQATTELPSIPFHGNGTSYSILGTQASLTVPDMRLYAQKPGEAWHEPLVMEHLPLPVENAYANQLAQLGRIIDRSEKPLVGIADAISTQAALDAITLSAQTGERVDVQAMIREAFASAPA